MAGPRTMRNAGNGGVRVREAEYPSAPFHVSDEPKPRNNNPKSTRIFQRVPQPYAALTDRPSTSSGVSTRKTIEKRGTKDDLHVSPLRANQFGTTYYNFPLPGSLPTPAATPKASPSRTYTPGISEQESDTHLEIGMALGSPSHQTSTHQTTIWSPHVQFQAPVREYSPESLDEWQNSTVSQRPKASKWKKWFGRKTSDSSVEYSQPQREVQTMNETDYVTFPDPPAERPRGRARTNSERNIKQKPDTQRANTVPLDFQFQDLNEKSLPRGPKQFPILTETRPPEIKLDGGPLLNVDIPTIEMERYSVMFGSVIKPTSSVSSLLARRQATLDKLKMVNEAIAEHVSDLRMDNIQSANMVQERQEAEIKSKLLRPRRVTSPQLTKSPAMSLFPNPSRTQRDGLSHTRYRATQLHRSNTSPAALSPNRQTFEPLRPHEEEHTIMLAPTPTLQPSGTLTSPWSADESFLALDSPNSMTSIEEVHDPAPLKPRLTEPKWEMISPKSVPEDPMKVKPLRLAPKPDSKVQQLPRKQSLQSSLDALARAGAKEEAEELIRTAADVSIARQISVSRRQKQLLVPIKSRIANAGPLAASKEESAGVEGLLVNEKKPLVPRLVNVQAGRVVRSERAVFDRA
jgi:hypothetical protein